MKTTVYYMSPFVIIPIVFLIATILDRTEIPEFFVPCFLFAALFLFVVAIDALSPLNAQFDYLMTIIIPLSVFFALFISLLFDEGCNGAAQFSLHHALNLEYYRTWFPIAIVILIITFVFSFKPIRNFVKSKFSFKQFGK